MKFLIKICDQSYQKRQKQLETPFWHLRSPGPDFRALSKFQPLSAYQQPSGAGYQLLPFRFTQLDDDQYVLTNQAGEFIVLNRPTLEAMVRHTLCPPDPHYEDLISKHFISDGQSSLPTEL